MKFLIFNKPIFVVHHDQYPLLHLSSKFELDQFINGLSDELRRIAGVMKYILHLNQSFRYCFR